MKYARLLPFVISTFAFLLIGCQGSPLDGFFGLNNKPENQPNLLVPLPSFSLSGTDSALSFDFVGYETTLDVDFNQDGINDTIVSAVSENTLGGAYYVISGADLSQLYTVKGPTNYTFFGSGIKVVDDLNNDGIKDIISGSISSGWGKMTLTSGADGSQIWEATVNQTWFAHVGTYFMYDDINTDGYRDIIAYSRTANFSNGMIWGISGKDGSILWSLTGAGGSFPMLNIAEVIPDYLGADGILDLVVINNTKFRIISGLDGTTLLDCPGVSTHSAMSVPDQTSDTINDFIVTNQNYNSNRGMIQVISGADCGSIFLIQGENANDRLSFANETLQDLNADGIDEILAYASDYNSQQGKVYVISGADGSILSSAVGYAASPSYLTKPTSAKRDYNNDGYHDYYAFDGSLMTQKHLYFFSGIDSSLLFQFTSELSQGGDLKVLNLFYDLNNDGKKDLIISDTGADNDRGKVYIYSGVDQSLMKVILGANEGDKFGDSMIVKDSDGDGKPEFYISSSGFNGGAGKVYKYTDLLKEK